MFYAAVLWMRRGYTPHIGLKCESQKACITAGTWSQDEGCSHSKRAHVCPDVVEDKQSGRRLQNKHCSTKYFLMSESVYSKWSTRIYGIIYRSLAKI